MLAVINTRVGSTTHLTVFGAVWMLFLPIKIRSWVFFLHQRREKPTHYLGRTKGSVGLVDAGCRVHHESGFRLTRPFISLGLSNWHKTYLGRIKLTSPSAKRRQSLAKITKRRMAYGVWRIPNGDCLTQSFILYNCSVRAYNVRGAYSKASLTLSFLLTSSAFSFKEHCGFFIDLYKLCSSTTSRNSVH